jgi:hypothetical protein
LNILLLSFLAFASVSLFAREASLPDSTSPDKHYCIVVAETGGLIYYHINEIPNGKTLFSLVSSYKPDSGSAGWGFQQSLGATVNWRKDSRYLAIDEENYRRIGTVLIASSTAKGFEQVPVYSEVLMRASKQPWERGRLSFREWGRGDTIILALIGLVQRVPHGQRDEYGESFTLNLADRGNIMSIDTDNIANK